MRSGLVSKFWTTHRLACLALYRALLKQCDSFPKLATCNTLRLLVRYRFSKDRKFKSPSQISNALDLGYHALSLLRQAGAGSDIALESLTRTLSFTAERLRDRAIVNAHQAALRSPKRVSKTRETEDLRPIAKRVDHEPHPHTVPVLERPLPLSMLPSAKRIVPRLVVVHGVPFLRYGRLQPLGLSQVLRQIVAADAKRWARRIELGHQKDMARLEDEWDEIVAEETGYRDPPDQYADSDESESVRSPSFDRNLQANRTSWTRDIVAVDQQIKQKITEKTGEHSIMARKMWEIVVKERELAEQEQWERKKQGKLEGNIEKTAKQNGIGR